MRAALLAVVACSAPATTAPPKVEAPVKRTAVAEVVVDDAYSPAALAVDDSGVYYANSFALFRAEAGKPVRLAKIDRVWAIALDSAYVWWGDRDGVYRVPKQGGSAEKIATTDVFAFAKRGNEIVVGFGNPGDHPASTIVRLTADGKVVAQHVVDGWIPRLAIADDGIYVGTDRALIHIERSGDMHELAHGDEVEVAALLVTGGRVVYAFGGALMSVVGLQRRRIAEATGKTRAMAVDELHIYWATETGIYRASIAGAERELFERLDDGSEPASIVVYGEYLYWTNTTGGQVMRKRRR